MRGLFCAAALTVAGVIGGGPTDAGSRALQVQQQQRDHYELAGRSVVVYNIAGSVRIERGTGSSTTIDVQRSGPDAAQLQVRTRTVDGKPTFSIVYPGDEIASAHLQHGSTTTLEVDDNGVFSRSGHRVRVVSRDRAGRDATEADAELVVRVPDNVQLEVHQGVGDIAASGTTADLSLHGSSGEINVANTRGRLQVNTASGGMTIRGADGDLDLNSASGDIELENTRSAHVDVDVASGGVRATGLRAESADLGSASGDIRVSDSHVPDLKVHTASGSVRVVLDGELRDLDAESASGNVEIVVPSGFGAEIEMDTASGDIDSDFPISVTSQRRGHMRGTIGNGSAHLSLSTASGNVRLLKR